MQNKANIESIEMMEDNSNVFLRLLYRYLLNHWKWFVLCIIIALPFAYFYLYYSIPEYQVSSTILIKDPENKWKDQSKVQDLDLFEETKNVDNEIGIIKSINLNRNVVFVSGLYINVFKHGQYRVKEIYKDEPFEIIIDTNHIQSVNLDFYIDIISENEYRLYTDESTPVKTYNYRSCESGENLIIPEINNTFSFGEKVQTEGFSFKLVLNELYRNNLNGKTYHFSFHSLDDVAKSYSRRLQIERITEDATILRLSIKHPLPEKANNYLNTLSEEFIQLGLKEKNETATKTISFIDNMLNDVTESLNLIETNLQMFRSEKQIMDLSFEAKSLYTELKQLEKDKAIEEVRLRYYNYLKDYVVSKDSVDNIIAPSTIGISDPLLNILVQELISLHNERSKLLVSSTEENPYFKVLNTKIKNTKKSLLENVQNIINSSKLKIENIDKQIAAFKSETQKLPETERELINIERDFTINDQIYTYLLERRAEAAIAKASNIPDNKIVDYASLDGKTFPNSKNVYLITVFLALLLPASFFSLKYLFKNRISTKDDVISRTDIPFAGLLSHSKFEHTEVVSSYPKSMITETMRSLKTNLNFLKKEEKKHTLLFTSTLSREGKTFVSINMAAMYALSNQKVLLINADLRKPNVEKSLGISNSKQKGLSNILSNNCGWEDSIIQYEKNENTFDILPSGPIPPNPGEMLDSENMEKLMAILKDNYDVIIIDSPPVGIIADSLNLLKFCDTILYIFKHNYSFKNSVRLLNEIALTTEAKNKFAVVINDVSSQYSLNYSSYSSYNYGKYKYHGYYGKYLDEEKIKEGLLTRINKFMSTK